MEQRKGLRMKGRKELREGGKEGENSWTEQINKGREGGKEGGRKEGGIKEQRKGENEEETTIRK